MLVLGGVLEPLAALDDTTGHLLGAVVGVVSIVAATAVRRAMGSAWRTGTDPEAPEPLVVDGPFALVRNPVYTTMMGMALAAALLVPTTLGVLAVVVLVVALELQTRAVEEPHLRRLHGSRYAAYAARVGRFVPGLGRLR